MGLSKGESPRGALGTSERGERRLVTPASRLRTPEQESQAFPLGHEQSFLQPEGILVTVFNNLMWLISGFQVNKNMEAEE